jgi:putative oxidoreductase
MTEATSNHYIPALGNIYSAVNEYAEPILRIVLGGVLIPHGMQKLFGAFGGMGFAGNAALFDRIGFAAAAVLIFMIVAVKFTSARGGFFWSTQGFEYPLLIGVCALFFLIRGGGAWSLDRAIGREL